MANKYLVTYLIEGEICEPKIETASQIFNKMAMDDCYDIHIISLNWLKPYSDVKEYRLAADPYPTCKFCGTWHDPDDSLKMKIERMFGDMAVLDVGYAPDH